MFGKQVGAITVNATHRFANCGSINGLSKIGRDVRMIGFLADCQYLALSGWERAVKGTVKRLFLAAEVAPR